MWHRPVVSVLVALSLLAGVVTGQVRAADKATPSVSAPILQRFFSIDDSEPTEYRARRHLEAQNDHFNSSAWMDVWTEADRAGGFRYRIVGEGGSEYIRKRVFLPTLEAEQAMWASGGNRRAALTPDNYIFEDGGAQSDGLVWVAVKPRRKDVLLVEGSIILSLEDGDLVRVEGCLSKPPSFWTRHVDIVRRYRRFGSVRMPVALESTANVRIAGRSTFRMSYEYESINGQHVDSTPASE